MLLLRLLTLVGAAVLTTLPAASAKAPLRVTFDLDRYQGWWQVRTETGAERAQGECSGLARCRPWLELADGSYQLAFSDQPQSEPIWFALREGAITVRKGGTLVAAEGNTVRLTVLKPVTVTLNGYIGPWSIGKWTRAREEGFFTWSGASQKLDLVPLTTYALAFGAGVSERFQVGLDGKLLLIDSKGAVAISAEPQERLDVQTIDAVVYLKPATKTQRWNVGFRANAIGRSQFEGTSIVRLVQGSLFELTVPGESPGTKDRTIETGKGCNMVTQTIRKPAATFHIVPIAASCSP